MILLENHSAVIQNVLTEKFNKPSKIDIQFVDYDNVRFRISTPSSKTGLLLSMGILCWKDLVKYGAQDVLEREYGDWLVRDGENKEQDYDISLMIDLEKIPEEGDDRSALISHFAHLKPTLFSSPFHVAFSTQPTLSADHSSTHQLGSIDQAPTAQGELMVINYREDEAIYIQSSWDRVTVIFSVSLGDETDRVFGRVFLQEFVDARRLPSLGSSPQVLYTNRDPPLEIRELVSSNLKEDVSYVTFVLSPRHFSSPEIAHNTALSLAQFRTYYTYHIKCTKAYMRSRYRLRVSAFQQVLNRARMENNAGGEKERKTATGRTFRTMI